MKNKYLKKIKQGLEVDVYDVLSAFNVTDQALGHAIKKLLCPGQRGAKSWIDDVSEARASLDRAIEIALRKNKETTDSVHVELKGLDLSSNGDKGEIYGLYSEAREMVANFLKYQFQWGYYWNYDKTNMMENIEKISKNPDFKKSEIVDFFDKKILKINHGNVILNADVLRPEDVAAIARMAEAYNSPFVADSGPLEIASRSCEYPANGVQIKNSSPTARYGLIKDTPQQNINRFLDAARKEGLNWSDAKADIEYDVKFLAERYNFDAEAILEEIFSEDGSIIKADGTAIERSTINSNSEISN